ncbi:MAG: 3-keto-5-aminohexanoate cleavage protein [Deltaproteobacteria bacterium]|nr:3-keto-5-aminohexanoate cleavage protein [Deltaproteobacteria bacterium]
MATAGFGKVIVEVRANEYTSRRANPHVPFSAEELGADAAACREAGAAIYHFHAREPKTGAPAYDVATYGAAVRAIRAAGDLLINPTLGANTVPDPKKRAAIIPALARDPATRPDLAPVDLASINVDPWDPATKRFLVEDMVYATSVAGLREIAATIRGAGVLPQAVLWNIGSARLLGAFVEMGVLAAPVCAQAILSSSLLSTHPATVRGLTALLDFVPTRAPIFCTIGNGGGNLLPLVAAALERGAHVAIGLGDYAYPELGAPTNAELVREVARIARGCGRELATPAEVRGLLGVA